MENMNSSVVKASDLGPKVSAGPISVVLIIVVFFLFFVIGK